MFFIGFINLLFWKKLISINNQNSDYLRLINLGVFFWGLFSFNVTLSLRISSYFLIFIFIESKKFRSGSGGEYPAMREAIGQLMTGCPDRPDVIPVVAVPYSTKSAELAQKWSFNKRIRMAGIRFMLVQEDGSIVFI